MRTIKFKAWDIQLKLIVDVATIEYIADYDREKDIHFRRIDSISIRYTDEEGNIQDEYRDHKSVKLIQFTGRHDKKGIEIYEGHIIEHENCGVYIIVYDEEFGKFEAEPVDGKANEMDIEWYLSKHTTIIGNKYKNPELLEEEK